MSEPDLLESPVPVRRSLGRTAVWLIGLASSLVLALALWIFVGAPPAKPPEQRLREILLRLESDAADRAELTEAAAICESSPRFQGFRPLFAAAIHLADKEYRAAIAVLEQRPSAATQKAALLVIGKALHEAGRPNDAAVAFRQLMELDPQNLAARFGMVRYWQSRGSAAEGMSELERITEIDPTNCRAWRELGAHAYDFRSYSVALRCLNRALECDPSPELRQEILLELGELFFHQRNYEKSVEAFRLARPSPLGEAIRAEACESLGLSEEADESLARAKSLDPSDRMVRLVTARIALQRGTPEVAVESMVAQLQATPNDRDCRFQLAQAYSALGETERAAKELARFQELDELTEKLSRLLVEATKLPQDVSIREELADVCGRLGQIPQANAWRLAAGILKQERQLSESPK